MGDAFFVYPDRESNSELSFRRALLYPFNYQGACFSDAKVRISENKTKDFNHFLSNVSTFALIIQRKGTEKR